MMNLKIKTILASASPRRLELLNLINIYPLVRVPEINEEVFKVESPEDFVSRIAVEKGKHIRNNNNFNSLIISADTIVLSGTKIIGKPSDREDASKMLGLLSGKLHKVITGISILYEELGIVNTSVTDVKFSNINSKEIEYYLDNEIFMDKAGAYAIQGKASIFVERINGCYFNVMGFPLNLFYSMIRTLKIPIEKIEGKDVNEGNVELL